MIEDLFRRLQSMGYSCRAQLLNSADFGSYQRRVRCFIFGVKHGTAPAFPDPTHAADSAGGSIPRHRTLGEFLSDHADKDDGGYVYPSRSLGEALSLLPDGSGIKSAGISEPTRPGGHWGYRQGTFIADKSKPARTVTGSASQDWVRWNGKTRRLTLLEVKLLQGFPSDWDIAGGSSKSFKQIGNAVPAVFGELLAGTIARHITSVASGYPVQNDLPMSFRRCIDYTVRDQAKNGSARKRHRQFVDGSK